MAGRKTTKKTVANTEKTSEKEYLFYLIIASFLALMLPHLIRFLSGNITLISGQAYYHSRIADQILLEGEGIDMLVYGSRDFVFLPYHYLLAGTAYFTGTEIASKLLPFALGMLSLMMFYLLLKNLKIRPTERFFISLLLIVSPPFIYLFTVSTPSSLSVFLILLGFCLFSREGKLSFAFSVPFFILASFSGVFNMVLIAIMLFFFYAWDSEKKARAFVATLILLGFYFVHPVPFYYNFEFPVTNILKVIVSDLGAKAGFSPFAVILAVIGVFHSWKEKGRYYPLYISFIFITISTVYIGGDTSLYNTLIITVFASMGLKSLSSLEWKFTSIKNLSFILVGCGLLFSTASYLDRMPLSMPDNGMAESLKWLNENSDPGQVVLSHYSRGYWIESMAARPAVIDGFSSSIPNFDKKDSDINRIFYGIELDETADILRTYNLSFIFIDNEMRKGLVWGKEKEGLLYLLRNNMTFKKEHSSSGSEIWKVDIY